MIDIKFAHTHVVHELRQIRPLLDKVNAAMARLEISEKERTIINVATADVITLYHALHCYRAVLESQEVGESDR